MKQRSLFSRETARGGPGFHRRRDTPILADCERFTRPYTPESAVDGEQLARFEIVALDGRPLAFQIHKRASRDGQAILVPPAGKSGKPLSSGSRGAQSQSVRTNRCFDTGHDGDPIPAMVVADSRSDRHPVTRTIQRSSRPPAPLVQAGVARTITRIEKSPSTLGYLYRRRKRAYTSTRQEVWSVGSSNDERIHRRVSRTGGGEWHARGPPFNTIRYTFSLMPRMGADSQPGEWLDYSECSSPRREASIWSWDSQTRS